MTINTLNIVRDCWWLHSSGDSYITDQDDNLSTFSKGLYKSLNSNDSEYIKLNGSGAIRYYGRLETSNLDVEAVYVDLRASGDDIIGTSLYINSDTAPIITFDSWSGLETQTKSNLLTDDTYKKMINVGRIDKNYDYFHIDFVVPSGLDHVPKLYNVEISYSGTNTWDNHKKTI